MLQAGEKIDGKFTLVRELGSGGMGAVWLLRHEHLGAPFAAKFLTRVGPSATLRARFFREARLVARLRGPHVPQIFDLGEWRGVPYILMEFLEGEDLRQRLDRGVLSATEMLRLVVPIARVLARAHGLGIVHRDLKPENVFLAKIDGEEQVKVLDFGIAKVLSAGALASVVTRTDAVLGTPYYMSPEQFRNSKHIDHRADLWALALLVFEMLVGRRAFLGDSISQIVLQIETQELPDPLSLRPELPAAFRSWWGQAAARRPEDRFPDVVTMVKALAQALELPEPDQLISSPPRQEEDALAETDLSDTAPDDEEQQISSAALLAREASPARSSSVESSPAVTSSVRSGLVALIAAGVALGAFWLGQRSSGAAPQVAAIPPPRSATQDTPPPSSSLPSSALPLSSDLPQKPAVSGSFPAVTPPSASSSAPPLRARPVQAKQASSSDTIGF